MCGHGCWYADPRAAAAPHDEPLMMAPTTLKVAHLCIKEYYFRLTCYDLYSYCANAAMHIIIVLPIITNCALLISVFVHIHVFSVLVLHTLLHSPSSFIIYFMFWRRR